MKTDNSDENDVSLSLLLKEWKQEAPLPPRFQEQVWQRMERARGASVPSVSLAAVFANWVTNLLPRPALATGYVAVLLVIGASMGWSQARHKTTRVFDELSARYAQAVAPYRTTPKP